METAPVVESVPESVTVPSVEPKIERPKPWIAAGFKTRDEWRQSKIKAGRAILVSKPAKTKKTASPKSVKKTKKSAKKAESVREPSARQQKLLNVFNGIGKPKALQELGDAAFPSESKARRCSWVRNQMRWLLANKYVKRVKEGVYQRIEK